MTQSGVLDGSGSGPFVNVVDYRWRGELTGSSPVTGIAFRLTGSDMYWVKAAQASLTLPVHVSLHAYTDFLAERATSATC
jgi:hypothetical protein